MTVYNSFFAMVKIMKFNALVNALYSLIMQPLKTSELIFSLIWHQLSKKAQIRTKCDHEDYIWKAVTSVVLLYPKSVMQHLIVLGVGDVGVGGNVGVFVGELKE